MKKQLLNRIFFLLLVFVGNYAYSQTSTVTGTVRAKEARPPNFVVPVKNNTSNCTAEHNRP